jgi:quercetin dioxygenase-like cupin family protein
MQHINDVTSKEIAPGISGKYVHGTSITFGYVHIKAGSILHEHRHINEQITYIVAGELELKLGSQTFILLTGSTLVIPSNTPHSAIARGDCIVIDVFSPVRNDYK